MQETDKLFACIQESEPCLIGINASLWAEATTHDRIPSQEELVQFYTSVQFMREKELTALQDAYLVLSDQQLEEIFMAYARQLLKKKKND